MERVACPRYLSQTKKKSYKNTHMLCHRPQRRRRREQLFVFYFFLSSISDK